MQNNSFNKIGEIFDRVTSLIDILNLYKESIKNELHVGTIALYKEIVKPFDYETGYGIINILPMPLNKNEASMLQQCYYFKDESFIDNQIITIIYTDLNFDTNLKTNKNEPIKNDNPLLHNKSSAVLVSTNSVQKGPKLLGTATVTGNVITFRDIGLLSNNGIGILIIGSCCSIISLYNIQQGIHYYMSATFEYGEGELYPITKTIRIDYLESSDSLQIISNEEGYEIANGLTANLFIINL